MYKKILLLLCILVLSSQVALAFDTDEYFWEFSNPGETCEAVDIFVYRQDFSVLSQSRSLPALYSCCTDDACTNIIVDLEKKQLMNDDYFRELVDLNFIKYSMSVGNLTTTSFVSSGIDACYFHGSDELTQQSLNLAANTVEAIAATQKTKEAKQVTDAIRLVRAVELVNPFSIADFSLGVGCKYNDGKINKAVEKITECNLYLSNIQNNYAEVGYVNRLDVCLDEARDDFKEYGDSTVAKAKNVIDKGVNVGQAVYRSFNGLFNPEEKTQFTVEETEYEVAGRIYNEIKGKKLYLHNPQNEEVFNKYAARILQKREDYGSIKEKVVTLLGTFSKNGEVSYTWFYDAFYEPNHNLSKAKELLQQAETTDANCELLYSQVKYNSAIKCLEAAQSLASEANSIIERELNIPRVFDKRWLQGLVMLLVAGAVFIGIKRYVDFKKGYR